MKQVVDKIVLAIKDHSMFMAVLGVFITFIGGAYTIGMQLGSNRQEYLQDRISSLESSLDDERKRVADLNSSLLQEKARMQLANVTNEKQEREISELKQSGEERLASLNRIKEAEIAEIQAELDQAYATKRSIEKQLENSDSAFKTKISSSGDVSKILLEELNSAKMRIGYLEDVTKVQAGRIRDLQPAGAPNP